MKSLGKNVVFLCLLVGSAVVAQPAPSPDQPTPPVDGTGTVDGTATDDTGAVISGQVTVTLTVPEMTDKIAELDKQTEDDAAYVLRLQIKARKDKDVIKLNCINDKLLQIKALRNIIEGAKTDFDIAVSGNSADEQQYQFTRITMSADNIRALREEANACAGEIPDHIGETTVDWTGPDIPPEDNPFGVEIEPPGYASPFN